MRNAILSSLVLGALANIDYLLAQMPSLTSVSVSPECTSAAKKLGPAPAIPPELITEMGNGAKACSFDPPSSLTGRWHSWTEAANQWIEQNTAALKDMKHYCPHALMNPCPETTADPKPTKSYTIVPYTREAITGIIPVPVEYDELAYEKLPSCGKAMITDGDITTSTSSETTPTTRSVTVTVYQDSIIWGAPPDDLVAAPNDGVRTGPVAMAVVFGAAIAALAIW